MACENERRVNKAGLAKSMDVSLMTVDRWLRRGCPVVERGGNGRAYVLDLGEVLRWREERAASRAERRAETAQLEAPRARKIAAQAEMAQIRLSRMRAELVPVAVVCEFVGAEYQRVRSRIEAMVSKLSPPLAVAKSVAECRQLIRDAVNEALAELSSPRPSRSQPLLPTRGAGPLRFGHELNHESGPAARCKRRGV